MKKKRILLLLVTLLFSFSATGCGDALIEMTPEEEDTIVAYAAKMVAKYNIYQKDGVMFVSDEEESSQEETTEETENGDNPSGEGESEQVISECSLEQALGLSGVSFSFQDISVSDHFDDGDVSSIVAQTGAKFVIMKFKMEVSQGQDIDIFSMNPVFKLNLNGEEHVQKTTVMPSDLGTFVDTVKANTSKTVVLIYELPEAETTSIDSYSLTVTVTKDGNSTTNAIKL